MSPSARAAAGLLFAAMARAAAGGGLVAGGIPAGEARPAAAAASAEDSDRSDLEVPPLRIPDVEVLDQDGRPLRFYSDLVKDRVVLIQFIFTTCTSVCLPLSAVFAQVQKELGPGSDVGLVSISVDPVTDVPARLKAHGERFGAGPGWTLITGQKGRIDELLRALGVYAPDRAGHTTFVLAGNDRTGRWLRTYGLAGSESLIEKLRDVAGGERRSWFTDLPLLDQHGNLLRFYSDVLEGKVVVVSFIFTRCGAACPLLMGRMRAVQADLGDLLHERVRLVTISVDPEYDTPEVLKGFAERLGAGPGWVFLTGRKENVEWVAYKLGGYAPEKEAHSPLFLVGDAATGRWAKLAGAAPSDEIALTARHLLAPR